MEKILLAVNGTLMRGLKLNANLLEVGAEFVQETLTASCYRLWSIQDQHPAMLRVQQGGRAIAVEVWAVPPAGLVRVLSQEPTGLCIGKVQLVDGQLVLGILAEPYLVEGQVEISEWGGWRSYCNRPDS